MTYTLPSHCNTGRRPVLGRHRDTLRIPVDYRVIHYMSGGDKMRYVGRYRRGKGERACIGGKGEK